MLRMICSRTSHLGLRQLLHRHHHLLLVCSAGGPRAELARQGAPRPAACLEAACRGDEVGGRRAGATQGARASGRPLDLERAAAGWQAGSGLQAAALSARAGPALRGRLRMAAEQVPAAWVGYAAACSSAGTGRGRQRGGRRRRALSSLWRSWRGCQAAVHPAQAAGEADKPPPRVVLLLVSVLRLFELHAVLQQGGSG